MPSEAARRVPEPEGAIRVLVVSAERSIVEGAAGALRGERYEVMPGAAEAVCAETRDAADVVLIDARVGEGCASSMAQVLRGEAGDGPTVILIGADTDVKKTVKALRAGIGDFIRVPIDPKELVERVEAGSAVARRTRAASERMTRLRRICKRLGTARQDVTQQLDLMTRDLASAYRELAEHMNNATLAAEFGTLVRQELDVESLLRTTLEFLLTKTGPTNAAVYLPTGSGDYALGAYVNYDMSRDVADVMLDHLADAIPHRFESRTDVVRYRDSTSIERLLGDDAHWLFDTCGVLFACRHEGEALAVGALFRDESTPFTEDVLEQLEVIRGLFAQQLDRVIRIHHRHQPDRQWRGFDVDTGEGWDDLAA